MKKFITLVFCIFSFSITWAQTSFTNSPSDTVYITVSPNGTVQDKIQQLNNTSDSLFLGVRFVSSTIPKSWDGLVCIEGVCLNGIPQAGDSAAMLGVSKEGYGYVQLTVSPLGAVGTCEMRVYVYNMKDPSDGDTITFIATSVLSSPLVVKADEVSIYPNPLTSSNLTVEASNPIKSIKIYNDLGHVVYANSTIQNRTAQLDLRNLGRAHYNIFVEHSDGTQSRQHLFIIQ